MSIKKDGGGGGDDDGVGYGYKFRTSPMTVNPRECIGYPSAFIRHNSSHEPTNTNTNCNTKKCSTHEINFYLHATAGGEGEPTAAEDDHDNDNDNESGRKESFCTRCTKNKNKNKQLQSQSQPDTDSHSQGKCDPNGKVLACSLIVSTDHDHEYPPVVPNTTTNTSIQEQLSSIDKTKPILLLCHGLLSWRNQMLLANLASSLSTNLSCHTLRFDFGGNGHSSGNWNFGDYEKEADDLMLVADFVESERGMGCRIACVIGHSQGSAAVMNYAHACASFFHRRRQDDNDNDDRHHHDNLNHKCHHFVNLAGRYTTSNDFDPSSIFTAQQCQDLHQQGYFHYIKHGETVTNQKPKTLIITKEAIQSRNSYDISIIAKEMGTCEEINVLTIHGDQDETVPVEHAHKWNEVVKNHSIKIIEGANHNFNGLKYMHDLITAISSFLEGVV